MFELADYSHNQPRTNGDNLIAIPTLYAGDKNDGLGFYTKDTPEANVVGSVRDSITHIQVSVSDGQGHTGTLLGSGIIVDASGLTGTKNHVVNPKTFRDKSGNEYPVVTKQIQVQTSDGQIHAATVVDSDASTDEALIRLQPLRQGEQFKPVTLGTSDVKPLEPVAVVAFPGTSNQLHLSEGVGGIYGSKSYVGSIDPSAPANVANMRVLKFDMHTERGESGGGMFDMNGRLIGQVEAIVENPQTGVPRTTMITPVEDLIALIEHSKRTFGNANIAQTIPTPGTMTGMRLSAATIDLPSTSLFGSGLPRFRYIQMFA